MHSNGIAFLILLTCALPPARASSGTPDGSGPSFLECEQKVRTLIRRLYPGKSTNARRQREYLHTQLACGGLPGDPQNAPNWRAALPSCPLRAPPPGKDGWVGDPSQTVHRFHPGATSCLRKVAGRSWPRIAPWLPRVTARIRLALRRLPPGQQCCFDREGRLITDGPGAGTPDLVFAHGSSEMQGPEHEEEESLLRRVLDTTDPLLGHYLIDVRIILKKFPHWPQGWETYNALGWGPLNPKDAPENWGDFPKPPPPGNRHLPEGEPHALPPVEHKTYEEGHS